ncbi:unnamed protein product [Mytilus coruscus]|uniref:Uncharacterized protein n=1 Tax=Mytilus coruscus TaxID=42192 RepID=A0A6J7ZZC5_MYTCO|nr:unnamed protein product [Mytilus coruscus]
MEFSKNEPHQTSDSRKKHRTGSHSNQMEVNPDEDSDGSEYYSAEEEFLFTSSSSSISSDDESVETGPLDQSSDSVFDSLQSSCSSNFTQADTPHLSSQIRSTQERQRAPSKKQKRKRKQSGNATAGNTGFGYLPFCNIESFDIELSELREEIVDLETNILKAVPSLVELCISASKRLAKTHSFINVPKSIKRILQIGNSSHSFRQLQLDYLLNVLEATHMTYDSSHVHDYNKLSVNLLPHRNIWSSGCGIDESLFDEQVQGSKPSSYFLCCYDYQSWISASKVYLNRYNRCKQISALAHTMDLMLPTRLAGNKQIRRRHKSDTNCQSAEMEQNMKRIQQYIRNKFSRDHKEYDIVFDDRVFDLVFPYVLWARGDIRQAAQAFLKLVDSESRVRVKAMYLYDAGRMSLQFGDSDSAVRYFHLAKDALATKQKYNKEDILAEIDRQTRMLCASSNDVGLLSFQKADRSLAAWMSAISIKLSESVECAGPLSAFDAFLCYFGSYWHDKTGSLYDEAVKRLLTLAEKEKYLYYYLSMIYALNGKTEDSSKMYRRFTAKQRPVTTSALRQRPVTTSALRQRPMTTSALRQQLVTTSALRQSPMTTSALRQRPMTTSALRQQLVTTSALRQPPMTTSALRQRPMTTSALRQRPVTTSALRQRPVTTSELRQRPVTTSALRQRPVTTSALRQRPVTTSALRQRPVTTSALRLQ